MSEYKLGAITVALTLARVLPVDIPFGAGLTGTPPIHAAFINAIKGAANAVSGNVRDAAVGVVTAVKLAGSVAKLCGRD